MAACSKSHEIDLGFIIGLKYFKFYIKNIRSYPGSNSSAEMVKISLKRT